MLRLLFSDSYGVYLYGCVSSWCSRGCSLVLSSPQSLFAVRLSHVVQCATLLGFELEHIQETAKQLKMYTQTPIKQQVNT